MASDPDQPACKAKAKSTGKACTRPVVPGCEVCRYHGGAAPQVRRAGAARVLEAEIRDELAKLDVSPIEDPFERLTLLAGQAVAWQEQIAARVNSLTEIRYEASGAGTEQLRSELALYERAMDRCAAILGMIAKLDIDARMARISELQSQAVIRAIDAAVAAMVAGAGPDEARKVAAREIRAAA